jgi:hypothetical protein
MGWTNSTLYWVPTKRRSTHAKDAPRFERSVHLRANSGHWQMPLLLAPKPKIARFEAFGSLAFEQERHQRTDLYSRIASFHSFCDAEHSDATTVFL